ncbi:MAG: hypothetical protein K0U59_02410 [Gammaproteobacteria bacterium]|nr:hypothetical protein [Gammaproteobacteria bacterium]
MDRRKPAGVEDIHTPVSTSHAGAVVDKCTFFNRVTFDEALTSVQGMHKIAPGKKLRPMFLSTFYIEFSATGFFMEPIKRLEVTCKCLQFIHQGKLFTIT